MSRVEYKGIRNYKMNIENIKNVIKQQIFMEPGHIDPLELRPRKMEKKSILLAVKKCCCVIDDHTE